MNSNLSFWLGLGWGGQWACALYTLFYVLWAGTERQIEEPRSSHTRKKKVSSRVNNRSSHITRTNLGKNVRRVNLNSNIFYRGSHTRNDNAVEVILFAKKQHKIRRNSSTGQPLSFASLVATMRMTRALADHRSYWQPYACLSLAMPQKVTRQIRKPFYSHILNLLTTAHFPSAL